jgi:hypothetical protein
MTECAMENNTAVSQAEILRKIKLQKALELAKRADVMLEGNTTSISEDEIAAIISEDRKKRYQEENGD